MRLADVNAMNRVAFVAAFGGVFEHSPWVAEAAWASRPFASVDALHAAMRAVVDAAGPQRQLALLRAHPELAGKPAVRGELTADSTSEQTGAGLSQCTAEEFARLQDLNARYHAKFGFPFILAVRGRDRAGILAEFTRRIESDRATEFAECLDQTATIARLRLDAMFER